MSGWEEFENEMPGYHEEEDDDTGGVSDQRSRPVGGVRRRRHQRQLQRAATGEGSAPGAPQMDSSPIERSASFPSPGSSVDSWEPKPTVHESAYTPPLQAGGLRPVGQRKGRKRRGKASPELEVPLKKPGPMEEDRLWDVRRCLERTEEYYDYPWRLMGVSLSERVLNRTQYLWLGGRVVPVKVVNLSYGRLAVMRADTIPLVELEEVRDKWYVASGETNTTTYAGLPESSSASGADGQRHQFRARTATSSGVPQGGRMYFVERAEADTICHSLNTGADKALDNMKYCVEELNNVYEELGGWAPGAASMMDMAHRLMPVVRELPGNAK